MKQVKSKNRSRIAHETLDNSLRLATTAFDIGTVVSEKPRQLLEVDRKFLQNGLQVKTSWTTLL